MTNEKNSSAKRFAPQELGAGNRWRVPATAEYLAALRQADEAVFQAILRGVVLRHTARALKGS